MDDIDTEKLRAVIAKATPGEWFVGDGGICAREMPTDGGNVVCLEPEAIMAASLDRWPAHAAYIAAFDPPTTAALLDTIDTLRQQLAEARVLWKLMAFPSGPEHAGEMADQMDKLLAPEASHD